MSEQNKSRVILSEAKDLKRCVVLANNPIGVFALSREQRKIRTG